jgi:hypothetical protein
MDWKNLLQGFPAAEFCQRSSATRNEIKNQAEKFSIMKR